MAVRVYVDTNILMEHEPLDTLPLSDIVGETVDAVVIPFQVLKEIDKHKYSTEKRLRRRAEAASKLIARLREQGSLPSGETLTIGRPRSFDYAQHDLDRESQDDRIVATILDQSSKEPDDRHILLTADQHFLVLADEYGVLVVEMMDHRLPPGEQQAAGPRPQPSLVFAGGATFMEATVPLPPDTAQLRNDALAEYWTPEEKARSATSTMLNMSSILGQWPKSMQDVVAHAVALEEYARTTMSALYLKLELENGGSVPADDVDVFLEFDAAACMPFDREDLPEYPVDRDPFIIKYGPLVKPMPNLQGPFVHEPEDGVCSVRYHFKRIKHGMVERLNPLHVVLADTENPSSFSFKYSIHSANLESAVEGQLHVKACSGDRIDFTAIVAREDSDE